MDHSRRPPSSYVADVFNSMGDLMDFIDGNFEDERVPLDSAGYQDVFSKWMSELYVPELLKVSPPERRANDVKRAMMLCQALDEEKIPPGVFAQEFSRLYHERVMETEPKESYLIGDMQVELATAALKYHQSKRTGFEKSMEGSFFKSFASGMEDATGRVYYTLHTEMIARLGEQLVFERNGMDYPGHKSAQHACGPEKEKLQEFFSDWVSASKEYLNSPSATAENAKRKFLGV